MNDSSPLTVLSADPRRNHGPLALVAAGSLAAVLLNLLLLYDVSSLLTGNIRAIVGDIVDTWEPSCWATLGLFVVFTVLAFLQAAFRFISQGRTKRLAGLSLWLCASGFVLALLSHAVTSFIVWGRFKLW